jgi:hypothetical protein
MRHLQNKCASRRRELMARTKAEARGAWSCVRKSVDLNQTMAVDAPTAERAATEDTALAADIDGLG